MRKKFNINLSIKRETGFSEDIVYFLLHYFRYILVITQITIIIVFFYRLKIDQEIVDLSDTVMQQKEILNVLQPFIKDVQKKHEQYLMIQSILDKQNLYSQKLNYLLSIFPADFYLTKLIFKENTIFMQGKSTNYLTVMRFYNRVKKDNKFESVVLNFVEKEGEFFTFSFEFKGFKLESEEKNG